MKKRTRFAGMLLVAVLLLAGCQGDKHNRYTYREAGITELNAKDYSAAIISFDLALEHSNGLVGKFELDVLKYRGEAEYQLEDYTAAAHTYDILIEVDEEKPEYLNMRSLSHALAGNWEKALEDYTKAGAMDKTAPGAELALQAVGAALEDQGELEKAMVIYQQAVADGMQNSEVYNRMGLCKLKDQAYDEALGYFDMGIKAGDVEVMPHLQYNKAVTYEYRGDFKAALECMQAYVAAYGSNADVEREIAFLETR